MRYRKGQAFSPVRLNTFFWKGEQQAKVRWASLVSDVMRDASFGSYVFEAQTSIEF